jgi:hypothetical protein
MLSLSDFQVYLFLELTFLGFGLIGVELKFPHMSPCQERRSAQTPHLPDSIANIIFLNFADHYGPLAHTHFRDQKTEIREQGS